MRPILLCLLLAACASSQKPQPCPPPASAPVASKLEMKSYFLVLLRRGPTWTAEKTPETKKLFEGHMANIEAMAKTGKLLIAGPMDADPNDKTAVAGIFLFDVPTKDEVATMMKGDPAIEAGRFIPEVLTWWGPAGISYPGQIIVPK